MNYLAIDFGTKRVGLAYSLDGLISTLPVIKNDPDLIKNLTKTITDYQIDKIFVGISEGKFSEVTKKFVAYLSTMIKLPIETVEESVSTIEAQSIFKKNKKSAKSYDSLIDSISAAVILNRVISS